MSTGWRLVLGALGLAAAAAGAVIYLVPRPPALGPLVASPPATSLSVRVGESVAFSVSAPNAEGFTWSVWDRPVSGAADWSYRPGPDDAGWQQVTLVVDGPGGQRRTRTWNVGVVAAVRPELTEVVPPPGALAGRPGAETRFRCGARVPAARSADRLRFEWTVDGRAVRRDELPATGATSELRLPPAEVGTHRVAVHVFEEARAAAVAEWTFEVAGEAEGEEAAVVREVPVAADEVAPLPASRPPPPSGTRLATVDGPSFAFGAAELSTAGGSDDGLSEVVRVMTAQPSLRVYVDGYTDSIGAEPYNAALSERRAGAVRDHLVERGVDAARIVTRAFGEASPVASNDTSAGRARNRRAEIVVQ